MPLLYHNNNSISNVTSFAQVPTGSPVLLSTATASGSASISFTSGIDSTYDSYVFKFINIHPATDNVSFTFNMSTDGGSNYNVVKTTTSFPANHEENDGAYNFGYQDFDLAQSTSYQILARLVGTETDDNVSGSMTLFNPSSTTFVKHFISTTNNVLSISPPYSEEMFIAGYGNTTSAINAIRFQMSSGNIDAGTIKMYGIKA